MDKSVYERIALELSVSPDILTAVLESNNVRLVPAKREYLFLNQSKEVLLAANIMDLMAQGLSPKACHNLLRLMAAYGSGTTKHKSLKEFRGKINLSEGARIRGVGPQSLLEIELLFDHIGIEYIE